MHGGAMRPSQSVRTRNVASLLLGKSELAAQAVLASSEGAQVTAHLLMGALGLPAVVLEM